MHASVAVKCLSRMTPMTRKRLVVSFWEFSACVYKQRESKRLLQIKLGISIDVVCAFRATFDISNNNLEALINVSFVTFQRWQRKQKILNSVVSERLDRIAIVCQHAKEVFESQEAAAIWMSSPNISFRNNAPIMICLTEIGARQVRRVLHALEWGSAA
ncbi:MbcA/ParS/Xre antitoxin family protein [Pseudomonas fragi]|uniref:MbcA/ParS/Xre antitoxin family protein n=1 Tax=Pseudomonas fragi TaxID=296 RepID=UPI0021CD0125|nr:MbcA/ParS/Xre antitoxin family protein [Pseudomonas fragi]